MGLVPSVVGSALQLRRRHRVPPEDVEIEGSTSQPRGDIGANATPDHRDVRGGPLLAPASEPPVLCPWVRGESFWLQMFRNWDGKCSIHQLLLASHGNHPCQEGGSQYRRAGIPRGSERFVRWGVAVPRAESVAARLFVGRFQLPSDHGHSRHR